MFWFGRYTERSACLARILEVQTSFSRGKSEDKANWSWIVTLYDDRERFHAKHDRADARNVIEFYLTDRDNPGSIVSSIHASRENARTLRALISTDLWLQVNAFYNRFRSLPASELSEARLAQTCQMVKKEAYAQLGVANATFYRDAAWRFFMFGILIERADQMSRLLDVRFAQLPDQAADENGALGDFGFWSVLLRSAASQQAFLRAARGRREPEIVARFLIFDQGLPRSISFCVSELERGINELRRRFDVRGAARPHEKIDILQQTLAEAGQDEKLVERLHQFNDLIQRQLADLTNEFARSFFGMPGEDTNAGGTPPRTAPSSSQSQSQNGPATQVQSSGSGLV
jgi:uncharacterized alpha-E superfamily protein